MAEEGRTYNRFWERVIGFTSEYRVDKRWILREEGDSRAFGSLRIVSHPDLKPGYLRSFCTFVVSRKPKSTEEIAKSIEEYQMEEIELEVYSVNENIETKVIEYEAPYQELQKKFGVKIFE
jgi:hypothetical protein